MTTKHTPGEWKVGKQYESRHKEHIPILSDIGTVIAITYPLDLKATDEDRANGNLIAAAPLLLSNLEQAKIILEIIDPENPAIKQIDHAIIKATA